MEVSQSAAPVATAAPAAAMAQPVAVAAAEPAVVAVTASQPELEANGQAASYIAADVAAGQAQTAAAVAAPPAAAAAAAAVPTPTPAPDKEEEEAPPAKKIRIEETAPTEVRICSPLYQASHPYRTRGLYCTRCAPCAGGRCTHAYDTAGK